MAATTLAFEASRLSPYTVIRVPQAFQNPGPKVFVVLGHQAGYAICIKATSKIDAYKNSREMMAGCIYFRANEVDCFSKETVIQPDNQHPFSHATLDEFHRKRTLDVLGSLPADFEAKLQRAARESVRMTSRERKRIEELVQANQESRSRSGSE